MALLLEFIQFNMRASLFCGMWMYLCTFVSKTGPFLSLDSVASRMAWHRNSSEKSPWSGQSHHLRGSPASMKEVCVSFINGWIHENLPKVIFYPKNHRPKTSVTFLRLKFFMVKCPYI